MKQKGAVPNGRRHERRRPRLPADCVRDGLPAAARPRGPGRPVLRALRGDACATLQSPGFPIPGYTPGLSGAYTIGTAGAGGDGCGRITYEFRGAFGIAGSPDDVCSSGDSLVLQQGSGETKASSRCS